MEAEKTLTNEEIIRELLDLLKKNTMKELSYTERYRSISPYANESKFEGKRF